MFHSEKNTEIVLLNVKYGRSSRCSASKCLAVVCRDTAHTIISALKQSIRGLGMNGESNLAICRRRTAVAGTTQTGRVHYTARRFISARWLTLIPSMKTSAYAVQLFSYIAHLFI